MNNSDNSEFQNADGLVACPRSMEGAVSLSDNFKLHFCSADELALNNGVCANCRNSLAKKNGHSKTRTQQPVELSIHEWMEPNVEHDHIAFAGGACEEIVQTTDFDWAAVDPETARLFENSKAEVQRETALAFGIILGWIWTSGWDTAIRRFATISAALRPDLVNDLSYTVIGERLGCTKAAISKAALEFQSKFGMKFSRSRSSESRKSMSKAMTEVRSRRPGWFLKKNGAKSS